MEGIRFVRDDHMSIAEGCYLPRSDLLGHIEANVHKRLYNHPELKPHFPSLLDVDLFVSWDGDKFLLFISNTKRGHLPTRGMETKHLAAQRVEGNDLLRNLVGFTDISDLTTTQQAFTQLGFTPGFAASGTFPVGTYTPEAMAMREVAGEEIAKLMHRWAEERRSAVEKQQIFLSHRGVDKPFIEKIDSALRQLNLRTWFDKDDLAAGDPLVRGIDNAFSQCAAAIFFISGDYVDAGIIRTEIDRAIHEAATRSGGFRVIPLVLAQHGGTDDRVPEPLRTLVWKIVEDIEVVPTILRSLPTAVQKVVRFSPLK